MFSERGMKFMKSSAKELAVEMSVNFCGSNAFMAKHLLHGPQIRTAFYKMGCERMPKCMGRDLFFNPSFCNKLFKQKKYHYPAEFCTSTIEEQDVLLPMFNIQYRSN